MSSSRRLVQSCLQCQNGTAWSRPPLQASRKRWLATEPAKESAPPTDAPTSPAPPRQQLESAQQSHAAADAPSGPRSSVQSASAQLAEARRLAHEQVQRLANTFNTSARKQANTIAASIHALELERRLKEVGGKINHATGYEEIERLRNDVGEKGQFAELSASPATQD